MNYTQNNIKSKNIFLIIALTATFIMDALFLIGSIYKGFYPILVITVVLYVLVNFIFLIKCFSINFRFKYSIFETIVYILMLIIALMFAYIEFTAAFAEIYMTTISKIIFFVSHALTLVAVIVNTNFARKQKSMISSTIMTAILIIAIGVLGFNSIRNGLYGQGTKVEVVTNIYDLNEDGETYSVDRYEGRGNTVVIPKTFDGKEITGFSFPSETNSSNITDVYIENTEQMPRFYMPDEDKYIDDLCIHVPINLMGDYQNRIYMSAKVKLGWNYEDIAKVINKLIPIEPEATDNVYINFQYNAESLENIDGDEHRLYGDSRLLSTWVGKKGAIFDLEEHINDITSKDGNTFGYLEYIDLDNQEDLWMRFEGFNKKILSPIVDSTGRLLDGQTINESFTDIKITFEDVYHVTFYMDNDTCYDTEKAGKNYYCAYSKLDELIEFRERDGFEIHLEYINQNIGSSLQTFVTINNLPNDFALTPVWELKAPTIDSIDIDIEGKEDSTIYYADEVNLDAQISDILDINGIAYRYTWTLDNNDINVKNDVEDNTRVNINLATPNLDSGLWKLTIEMYSPAGSSQITSLTTSVSKSVDLTVNKAPLTVTANDKEITYGEAPSHNGVKFSEFANGETSDVLDGTLEYTYDYEKQGDVGSDYEITLYGLTSDNYDIAFIPGKLTVNPKVVEITWTAPSSLVYSGTRKTPTAIVTNLESGDSCTVNIALTTGNDNINVTPNGFTYSVTSLGNSNYTFLEGAKSDEYRITPLSINSLSEPYISITLANNLTYNGQEQEQSVSRLVVDYVTITPENYDVSGNKRINAGTYSLTVSGTETGNITGTKNFNFEIAKLKVEDAQISLVDELTYDGNSQTQTISVKDVTDTYDIPSSDYFISNNTQRLAGDYTLTVTYNTDNLEGSVNINYEIARREAIVTPRTNQSKTYGESDPTLLYDVEGLVGSDSLGGTLSRESGNNVGSYDYVVSTLTNNNYDIKLCDSPSTFTILPKTVSIAWTEPSSLVYDGTRKVPTARITNLESGDSCSLSIALTTNHNNVNVGEFTYYATTLSNSNYAFLAGATESPTYTITPKEVIITPTTNQSKTYGESDPTLLYDVEGLVGRDSLTGTLTRASGEDARSYDYIVSTLTNNNYDIKLCENPSTFTINPKVVTIGWTAPESLEYDGTAKTPSARITNLESGDSCTVNITLTTGNDNINVTENRFTYYVTSLGNSNYTLPVSVTSPTYTITPKEVIITPTTNQSKTYGESDPTLLYDVEGLVNLDSLTGSLTRASGEDAGSYDYIVSTLTNNNYDIKLCENPSTFTINPKVVDITWSTLTIADLVYSGSEKVLTASVNQSDLVGEDTVTVTTTLTGDNTNVGSFSYTATGLSDTNYQLSNNNLTSQTYTITAKVLTATITNLSYTVGDSINISVTFSDTEGDVEFSSYYLEYEISTGQFTTEIPTEVGEYTIRITSTDENYTIIHSASQLVITGGEGE